MSDDFSIIEGGEQTTSGQKKVDDFSALDDFSMLEEPVKKKETAGHTTSTVPSASSQGSGSATPSSFQPSPTEPYTWEGFGAVKTVPQKPIAPASTYATAKPEQKDTGVAAKPTPGHKPELKMIATDPEKKLPDQAIKENPAFNAIKTAFTQMPDLFSDVGSMGKMGKDRRIELYKLAYEKSRGESKEFNSQDFEAFVNESEKIFNYANEEFNYKKLLEKDPANIDYKYALAYNQMNLSKTQDAINNFREIIASNPKYSPAYSAMAYLFSDKGQNDMAVVFMDDAIANNPNDAALYSNRSVIKQRGGDIEGAVKDLDLAKARTGNPYLQLEIEKRYLDIFRGLNANRDSKTEKYIAMIKGEYNPNDAAVDQEFFQQKIAEHSKNVALLTNIIKGKESKEAQEKIDKGDFSGIPQDLTVPEEMKGYIRHKGLMEAVDALIEDPKKAGFAGFIINPVGFIASSGAEGIKHGLSEAGAGIKSGDPVKAIKGTLETAIAGGMALTPAGWMFTGGAEAVNEIPYGEAINQFVSAPISTIIGSMGEEPGDLASISDMVFGGVLLHAANKGLKGAETVIDKWRKKDKLSAEDINVYNQAVKSMTNQELRSIIKEQGGLKEEAVGGKSKPEMLDDKLSELADVKEFSGELSEGNAITKLPEVSEGAFDKLLDNVEGVDPSDIGKIDNWIWESFDKISNNKELSAEEVAHSLRVLNGLHESILDYAETMVPEGLRKDLVENLNKNKHDYKNISGLPGEERIGKKFEQAQPDKGPGPSETGDSGMVQKAQKEGVIDEAKREEFVRKSVEELKNEGELNPDIPIEKYEEYFRNLYERRSVKEPSKISEYGQSEEKGVINERRDQGVAPVTEEGKRPAGENVPQGGAEGVPRRAEPIEARPEIEDVEFKDIPDGSFVRHGWRFEKNGDVISETEISTGKRFEDISKAEFEDNYNLLRNEEADRAFYESKKRPAPYVTKDKKYTVRYTPEGSEVVNRAGQKVSETTRSKVLKEYEDAVDYSKGETAESKASSEKISFSTPEEYNQFVSRVSENPLEIIKAYESLGEFETKRPYVDQVLNDLVDKIDPKSYERFGDPNLVSQGMAKRFFKKGGRTLDDLAMEASEMAGTEVTPQDIVDFVIGYKYERKVSPIQAELLSRFKAVTGMTLNQRVVEKALKQELEKSIKDHEQYLTKESISLEQAEREFYEAIERGEIPIEEPAKTSPVEGARKGAQEVEGPGRQRPKTEAAKTVGEQLAAAEKRLDAAKEKVIRKRKALTETAIEDTQDLFGERESSKEAKLFDERVSGSIEDILSPLKAEVDKIQAEVDSLKEKFKEEQGRSEKTLFDPESKEKVYEDIAGMKPREVAGRISVDPIIGGDTKNISQIIFDVSKGSKQRLFYAKPGRRATAGGSYSPGNSAIKIKFNGDLDVTAHELGHSIDDMFGLLSDLRDNPDLAVEAELNKFSPFGSKPPKGHPDPRMYAYGEGFAEFLRAYIVNPEKTAAEAPNLIKLYETKVHPEYRKAVSDFSKDVRTWAGSTGRDVTLSNVQWEPKKRDTVVEKILSKSQPNNMFSVTFGDKMAANMLNPMQPFNRAVRYVQGLKGIDKLLPENDPILLARLLLGVDGKASEILQSGMIDSKLNVLKDKNGNVKNLNWLLEPLDNFDQASIERDLKDVTAYMIAERTVELAKNLKREDILTGIGGGIFKDVDVAKKALDEISADPNRLSRIKEAANRYRELSDDILKYMVDKGRMSSESYAKIKENNLFYVALQRVMETEPGLEIEIFQRGKGGALGSKADVVKSIKGSTKAIQNPYTSLLDTLHRAVKESDRNETLKAFRDLLVPEREGMYDGEPMRLADIGVKMKSSDKDTVTIFVDGKPEYWKFQDDIQKFIKGLDGDAYKLPGVLTALPSALRWTTTHHPVFAARNIIRDFQDRIIKSNENSYENLFGIKDLVGDKEHWNEVARAGGLNSGLYMKDRAHYYGLMERAMDDLAKKKNTIFADPSKLGRIWEGYTNILQKSETINRVAEYRAGLRKGKELGMDDYNAKLYAALKSRDLMDFAVMGHWMKVVNQLIPFSNAAIQGTRVALARAKENPKAFAARMFAFSVAPSIAAWIINNQSEEQKKEYSDLPNYQRDLFYNFKIGPDKWVSFPKPYELSLVGSAVDRAMSYYSGDKKAFDGYAGTVLKSIFPFEESSLAGGFQPIIEGISNYDFFREKHIVPPHENALALSLRNTERSSRLGKAIENVAGIDARKADHFIKGSFSYMGKTATKLSDIGRSDEENQFTIEDLGLFKQTPAYNSKSVQEFLRVSKEGNFTQSHPYKEFGALSKKYFNAKSDEEKEKMAKVIRDYARAMLPIMNKSLESKIKKQKNG